jgi:hypothetical protein
MTDTPIPMIQPQPPPPPVYNWQPAEPARGMSAAALVCGIVGVVLGLIPLLFVFAWALGLVAVVLGLIARHQRKAAGARRGMALWGAWLGAAALALGVLGFTIMNDAFNDLDNDLEQIDDTPTGSGPGIDDIVDNPDGVQDRAVDRYAAYTECILRDEVPNDECPTPAEQAEQGG